MPSYLHMINWERAKNFIRLKFEAKTNYCSLNSGGQKKIKRKQCRTFFLINLIVLGFIFKVISVLVHFY